ncbi:hypothetical protein [Streptococcus cuniculi]|uniref:hypothetical protein n=1 Tax=Streptococcus cuniculi TaxID=1432788 RepID=UPI000A955DBF|nr:hypothetical protein [Streptococcus cuniculi]
MTKDGALAASSSYKLYGSTKTTTDETGNLLDINENIVNSRSSAGHIPWNNGGK